MNRHERRRLKVTNLDRLVHKILRVCSGQPHEDVVNAMLHAGMNVIQSVGKDDGRNQLILTYNAMFLSLVEFKDIRDDNLELVLRAVYALPDDDSRDLALLQHVRTLVLASSVCTPGGGTAH
jgi:hypothetical protein